MANDVTNILYKILARSLDTLRENAIMANLVMTDYSTEAKQFGATIDVPVPQSQTAADVTPSNTPPAPASKAPSLVQIQLNNWKQTDFHLTDKQLADVDANAHFIPGQTVEAVKALSNTIDQDILAEYKGVYGYIGTAGTTPFSTVSDITDARVRLNVQLAPVNDRRMLLDPTAEGKALQLAALSNLEQTGDMGVKIEGRIGRKFGFDWFMDQNVPTHTVGTATSITVASTTAAGASTIDVSAAAASGTLLVGDIFTIAGSTQTFVNRTSVTIGSATDTTLSIQPETPVIFTAGAAVTVKSSHVVNLAFQRDAIAFVSRPMVGDPQKFVNGTQFAQIGDPLSGINLRLEVMRQYKQTAWEFDVLWGAQLIRAAKAVRIAG